MSYYYFTALGARGFLAAGAFLTAGDFLAGAFLTAGAIDSTTACVACSATGVGATGASTL